MAQISRESGILRASAPFQRADGTVMTDAEIAAAATSPTPRERNTVSFNRERAAIFAAERAARADTTPSKEPVSLDLPAPIASAVVPPAPAIRGGRVRMPHGTPTPREAEAIAAVKQHGDMVAAARALGVSRKAIDQRLHHAKGRDVVFDWPAPAPRSVPSKNISETIPLAERVDAGSGIPAQAIDRILDEEVDRRVAASAPAAAWRERLEAQYIDLLLRRAEEAPADDPVFDRIERLVGMLAA